MPTHSVTETVVPYPECPDQSYTATRHPIPSQQRTPDHVPPHSAALSTVQSIKPQRIIRSIASTTMPKCWSNDVHLFTFAVFPPEGYLITRSFCWILCPLIYWIYVPLLLAEEVGGWLSNLSKTGLAFKAGRQKSITEKKLQC